MLKNKIIEYKNNNKVFIIKNFIEKSLLPDWNIVLEHIDNNMDKIQEYNDKAQAAGHPIEKSSSIIITGDIKYPQFGNLKEKIQGICPETIYGIAAFISLKERNIRHVHQDPYDNLYTQCLGTSIWRLWSEDGQNLIEQYTLEPGDVIFVPKYRHHDIVSLTPRLGLAAVFE